MEAATYRMMRELEDEHWWFVARRQILEKFVAGFDLPVDARVLEIGCGTGGNIGMLSRYGQLDCIEMDPEAAAMARDRGGAPVREGALPDQLPDQMEERGEPYHLVTLFDVIEHIDDDVASLAAVSRITRPGGTILVTVPAFPFLWSVHDDENHHKRRYVRKDLVALAERTGLTLEYVSYFNFWLFPPVAAVRLVRKVIPYEESWKDMKKPAAWINSTLRAVFASERVMLGKLRLPFGVSLLAVLSKPGVERNDNC